MKKILKVGFLIDKNYINNNIIKIIKLFFKEKNIKIFIINKKKSNNKYYIKSFILRVLLFIEYFKINNLKNYFTIN